MATPKAEKLIRAAKAKYGKDAYLGRNMFCPKCKKLVLHIRGIVPKCSECGETVDPIA